MLYNKYEYSYDQVLRLTDAFANQVGTQCFIMKWMLAYVNIMVTFAIQSSYVVSISESILGLTPWVSCDLSSRTWSS